MSKPRKIRYLSTAQQDLIDIFEYINRDNPTAAISQLEKVDRSISQLASNPFLSVIPNDKRLTKLGYRMLNVNSWQVSRILCCKV